LNSDLYVDVPVVGGGDGMTFNINSAFNFPEGVGAFPLNIQITNASGNSMMSSSASQMFFPVFGINPKTMDVSLDNANTTDWSTIDDYTAVPGLSFYAQDSGNELGNITFSSPVNLTDSAIIQGLVNFGQNVMIGAQKMRINSSALAALNTAATITMETGMENQPPLAVRDNNGNLLGTVPEGQEGGLTIGSDTLGSFSWNGDTGELSFTTTGFSEFDVVSKTTMDSGHKTATVTPGNDAEVDVPVGVTDGKVDVSGLLTGTTGTLPGINISSDTTVGHVDVAIPAGVTVTGEAGWDGKINTPTVKANSSVTVTGVTGATTVSSVLEIGSNDTAITFDKGVRILLHGQAGKRVGFSRDGVFTEITATCSADSQTVGDALGAGADCKRDVGSDLVVWTKHFTSFVTFTMVGSSGAVGGGGGGGSMPAAQITLRTPASGATYVGGAKVGIEWSAQNGAFVKYKISYSADNGTTWATVVENLTGTPAYLWTVSAISTTTGRIKVEGYDSSSNVLASAVSGAFTVNGVPGSTTAAPSATDDNATGNYDPKNASDNTPDINTDKGLTAPPAGTTVYCTAGTLIKGSLPSVYYCGRDGKRYVFVNDKAFFTWYADFKGVTTLSDTDLAKIPLGGNITYRPGKRMIKVQSDPKVYVVARNGTLRWVSTEAMAVKLFGANWNKMIDDVSDAFFVNYKIGAQL